MTHANNLIISWSGGKDISMAFYKFLYHNNTPSEQDNITLLTTINEETKIVDFQGISEQAIDKQATALDVNTLKVVLPPNASNQTYENRIKNKLKSFLQDNSSTKLIFGDINLEDIRNFREQQFQDLDLELIFPLWQIDTHELIEEFISLGFKAIISCVDTTKLDKSYLGKEITLHLINSLPENVDPCGENGGFHTYVYNGPIFDHEIEYQIVDEMKFKNNFQMLKIV